MNITAGVFLLLFGPFVYQIFAASECVIAMKLYDSVGRELQGSVIEVAYLADDEERVISDGFKREQVRFDGLRVSFGIVPSTGQRLRIRLQLGGGSEEVARFSFGYCGQRQTLVIGSSEANGGEGFSFVDGNLSGCRQYRDWWVKIMPMFGNVEQALNPEATVDLRSGNFRVAGFLPGVRHVLVAGWGKVAVLAIGVDVVRGGTSTLGRINVAKVCPPGDH